MRRALSMSWVMAIAVLPSRLTQSTISPSITAPIIGSSPVVGSSKNKISGVAAIARASATRFCIPPDSSAGHRSPTLPASPTWPSTSTALAFAAARAILRCASRPKATFSHTGRLSNSAPFWNSMPMRARAASRAGRSIASTFCPSISMLPASGSISPRMHFSSTDLPEPDPPITTMDVPGITSRSTPSSTSLSPKDLHTPRSRIFGTVVIGRRTIRSAHSRMPGSARSPPPRRPWSPPPPLARRLCYCSRDSSPSG